MPPRSFDLISVPPTPLVRNAWLSGRFYRLADGAILPVGMRFGMERLPETIMKHGTTMEDTS